ncbi:uncharacterized protein Z518_07651 [Rhinocladiella mackenziei CBS 650.93]|uniref:50S ribosomal protein YmL27 n=1 Tax=Rhinocladiella mackenziei CBS 650.93 TaxID=1442369 RepID=A0A0D2H0X9_9EURO|nr:uncharacterized protein Z518_07651 [Rhinocladiella mackenziei CBS 650.93]KIX04098.1 hypothetical protein Z518_07651 [Rhinocladiella mackenziei CBS 650.93]
MVNPSPQLCARLRFTTKQVGRGFYRGNRTGSMGAHNGHGGYVIDWRKTPHFNVPETENFSLTPFVTLEMQPRSRAQDRPDGTVYIPKKIDGLEFLRGWKRLHPTEYDHVIEHQENERRQEEERERLTLQDADLQEDVQLVKEETISVQAGNDPRKL